jgi:hypothetical protein
MPGRVINIHDAKIKTMSVGIKAMTVNDRQVTLAVFRQLLDVDLISDDGTLNGIPWGVINYHPDKCAEGIPHFHVVWQSGEELRRATIIDPPCFDNYTSDAADDYLTFRTVRSVFFGNDPPSVSSYNGLWIFNLKDHKEIKISAFESKEAKEARNLLSKVYGPYPKSFEEDIKIRRFFPDQEIDALNELFKRLNFQRARLNKSVTILQQEVSTEAKRRAKWRETIQGLRQLPQLFIAV